MRGRPDADGPDSAAWADYVRSVRPLPGREQPPEPIARPPPPDHLPRGEAEKGAARLRRAAPVAPLAVGDAPAGVDAASWNRLRTGRLAPERTLDLHGRTADAAYHALAVFLHRAQADRVRCVEIITGRGEGTAGGVIRRELPIWLNLDALRPLVLGAAHPHPANSGAVRLLLRRPR
jgi:DNA-nicking Smr family endonuclease